MLTKEEKKKTAKLCKSNPRKALFILAEICKHLQIMNVKDYHKKTGIPERTIYSQIKNETIAYQKILGINYIIKKAN